MDRRTPPCADQQHLQRPRHTVLRLGLEVFPQRFAVALFFAPVPAAADLLGHGGMGTVYLAHQSEPVERDVALKVVKLGMDTDQVLARFESEARAIFELDHPNIVCAYDAGELDRTHFLVMELVEGIEGVLVLRILVVLFALLELVLRLLFRAIRQVGGMPFVPLRVHTVPTHKLRLKRVFDLTVVVLTAIVTGGARGIAKAELRRDLAAELLVDADALGQLTRIELAAPPAKK